MAKIDAAELRMYVVYWCFAAKLQIGEYHEVLLEVAAIEHDTAAYGDWVADGCPQGSRDYVEGHLERPLIYADLWRRDIAQHLLILALSHVVHGVGLLADDSVPQLPEGRLLTLLRNVREHWDDAGGRSARALEAERPDYSTESHAFTTKWFTLYGVHDFELVEWLSAVESAVRGIPAPADEFLADSREPVYPSDRDAAWAPFIVPAQPNNPRMSIRFARPGEGSAPLDVRTREADSRSGDGSGQHRG